MDELAAAAGQDPLAFRRAHLSDDPRYKAVLDLAIEKSGWGSALPANRSRGVAIHKSFGSYVAQVAELVVDDKGQYKVDRVVCAVDCGVAINPDIIRAQMEGGIGYGLSPALMSEITINNGAVAESNFDTHNVVRMRDMPEVQVHIVASTEPPTGVGEPATPVIAPAVSNALFSQSGKARHKLPLGTKV